MIAITKDGLKVELFENGTWEKLEEKKNPITNNNIRNTYWGMNVTDVEKSEEIVLDKSNPNMLVGETIISGFEAVIAFDFINNELYAIRYIFVNEHSDDSGFVYDFDGLKNKLIKKYGNASKDDRYFTDELYEDTPSEWGMALGRGTLSYFTTWNTSDTEISLSLYGDNFETKFGLTYSSLNHSEEVNSAEEEASLNEL